MDSKTPVSKEGPTDSNEAEGTRRLPWARPRLLGLGSLRHLVRGATGPLGDPGTSVGKRPR